MINEIRMIGHLPVEGSEDVNLVIVPQHEIAQEYRSKNLTLHYYENTVIVEGEKVHLTASEFSLLWILLAHLGSVVQISTVEDLLRVRKSELDPRDVLYTLRKRLAWASWGGVIKTVGSGYVIPK